MNHLSLNVIFLITFSIIYLFYNFVNSFAQKKEAGQKVSKIEESTIKF